MNIKIFIPTLRLILLLILTLTLIFILILIIIAVISWLLAFNILNTGNMFVYAFLDFS